MSASDLHLRPALGLLPLTALLYLSAALAVLALPLSHGWLKPLLVLLLATGFAGHCRRGKRLSRWWLKRLSGHWWLQRDATNHAVDCDFNFLSPHLVVVRVRLADTGKCYRLPVTARGCRADEWRRLQVLGAEKLSGVVDDDVLSGEINGHKNRVPGNF